MPFLGESGPHIQHFAQEYHPTYLIFALMMWSLKSIHTKNWSSPLIQLKTIQWWIFLLLQIKLKLPHLIVAEVAIMGEMDAAEVGIVGDIHHDVNCVDNTGIVC